MIKTFYGNQRNNFGCIKTKANLNKIQKNYISKKNKENIINLEEPNSKKFIERNSLKNNTIDGYIYYGNKKVFKIKNNRFSLDNISNSLKTQKLLNKINNNKKYLHRNLSNNSNINILNNYNSAPKFHRRLSENILNNIGKGDILKKKIENKFDSRKINEFPFILRKIKDQNEKNYKYNIKNNTNSNIEDNFNIQFQNLKELHKNLINSIKIQKNLFHDNNLFEIEHDEKKLNNNFIKKNLSQEYIDKSIFHGKTLDKKEILDVIKENKKNIKTIKTINKNKVSNIKKYFRIKNIIKRKQKNKNGQFIHSLNSEISVKDSLKNKDKENSINQNEKKQTIDKNIKSNQKFDYIFSNPNKNRNFSFRSTKNMKVTEDNENISINDTNKENNNTLNNSKPNFNYKTSTYFFSPKFKKKYENNSLGIKDIINNVIENNIKAGKAYKSSDFYNLGKNYINNRSKHSKKKFYYSSYEKDWNKEQTKEEINKENNNNSRNNSLKLFLTNPELWEKHEDIWKDISKHCNKNNEMFIYPPNDNDILISCYLKLFGKKCENEFIKYSKINIWTEDNNKIISIVMNDDNIKNPRNEIKKWKKAYKISLLRWHPDKLFPLLNELNIKNRNIINDLRRRSTIIINNINIIYQNVMEILNKILLNKK